MWLAEVHDGCLEGSMDAQFAALLTLVVIDPFCQAAAKLAHASQCSLIDRG